MWFLKEALEEELFAAYLDIDHGDIEEFLNIKEIGSPIQNLFMGVLFRLLDARYD